jgi:hypothetical protein
MHYSDEQVDQGIVSVIRHGAENRGQTVYYTQVFEAAGLPQPQALTKGEVSAFMEDFHFRLAERHLPPLDALVVVVAGERQGLPGSGYFRVNGLIDPAGDLRNVTTVDVNSAWDYWKAEKLQCEEWGHLHRRRRSP